MRMSMLLVVLLAACGGKIDGEPAETSPPPPPTSAVPTAPPPPDATTLTHAGSISITTVDKVLLGYAHFPFEAATPAPTAPTTSACGIQEEPEKSDLSIGASAGDIVITAGSLAPYERSSLTLPYEATSRTYEAASLEGSLVPLQVNATGGPGVPAFEAKVEAAAALRLDTPVESTRISASSGDLDVTWTPTSDAHLVALLEIRGTSVTCGFVPTAGHGVIPAALIRKAIEAKPGIVCLGSCTRLQMVSIRTTHVVAGNYDVAVSHNAVVMRDLTLVE